MQRELRQHRRLRGRVQHGAVRRRVSPTGAGAEAGVGRGWGWGRPGVGRGLGGAWAGWGWAKWGVCAGTRAGGGAVPIPGDHGQVQLILDQRLRANVP